MVYARDHWIALNIPDGSPHGCMGNGGKRSVRPPESNCQSFLLGETFDSSPVAQEKAEGKSAEGFIIEMLDEIRQGKS